MATGSKDKDPKGGNVTTGSKDGKVPKDPKDDEDKDPKKAKDAKDPKDAKVKDGSPGKAKPGSKKALKIPLPVDEVDEEAAAQDEQAPKDGKYSEDGKQAKDDAFVSLEDKVAKAWEARVRAERQADEKAKELAEDKAVGEAEAGELRVTAKKPLTTTRLTKRRKVDTIRSSI